MTKLTPEEMTALARYIHSVSGINLDSTKAYLVESRLADVGRDLGCGTYGELYFKARADATGAVRRRVIDAITTGETLFFRDTAPFELLRHKILPDLIDARTRAAGGRLPVPLRIWSAASSSGQEIYSIGIAIRETLGNLDKYDVRLVGTDIADKAVAAASRGIYGRVEIERGLPPATLQRWFTPVAEGWKIQDDIRGLATFRTLNLMEDFSHLGKFDIIFCRNVAIYFSEQDRASVFRRLGRSLQGDGYLVIGSTESLSGICPEYESKRHLRSVYYQLRNGAGAVTPAAPDRPAISGRPAGGGTPSSPLSARTPLSLARPVPAVPPLQPRSPLSGSPRPPVAIPRSRPSAATTTVFASTVSRVVPKPTNLSDRLKRAA